MSGTGRAPNRPAPLLSHPESSAGRLRRGHADRNRSRNRIYSMCHCCRRCERRGRRAGNAGAARSFNWKRAGSGRLREPTVSAQPSAREDARQVLLSKDCARRYRLLRVGLVEHRLEVLPHRKRRDLRRVGQFQDDRRLIRRTRTAEPRRVQNQPAAGPRPHPYPRHQVGPNRAIVLERSQPGAHPRWPAAVRAGAASRPVPPASARRLALSRPRSSRLPAPAPQARRPRTMLVLPISSALRIPVARCGVSQPRRRPPRRETWARLLAVQAHEAPA